MTSRLNLIAIAAGLSLAGGAAMAQPDDWSGPYIGVNAGFNGDQTHERGVTTVNPPTAAASFSTGRTINGAGPVAGGQLGYNVQHGSLVWGAEGDFDGLWDRKSHIDYYASPATGGPITARSLADPSWMASARGRVGFAADRALLYATGGAAFADLHDRATSIYSPSAAGAGGPYASYGANGGVHVGWTAGAGVEFMTTHNMTLGAEYRHTDIGGYGVSYGSTASDGVSDRFHSHFTDDAVLAKVNFKFSNLGHMF